MPTDVRGGGNSGIMALLNILQHNEVSVFSFNNMRIASCYEVTKAASRAVQKTTCSMMVTHKLRKWFLQNNAS